MKKLVTSILIGAALVALSCLPLQSQGILALAGNGPNGGDASITYTIAEDCEGTGTPSGWTDTGSPDWDSTTVSGSGSEVLETGSNERSHVAISDNTYYCAVFRWRMSTVQTSTRNIFNFRTSSDGAVCMVRVNSSEELTVYVDGADSTGTTDTVAADTWYWIKLVYDEAGNSSVEFVEDSGDTSPTFLGSGNKYRSRPTGSGGTIERAIAGNTGAIQGEFFFDQILVAQEDIPAGEAP